MFVISAYHKYCNDYETQVFWHWSMVSAVGTGFTKKHLKVEKQTFALFKDNFATFLGNSQCYSYQCTYAERW